MAITFHSDRMNTIPPSLKKERKEYFRLDINYITILKFK